MKRPRTEIWAELGGTRGHVWSHGCGWGALSTLGLQGQG